jgi:hypothetical protein
MQEVATEHIRFGQVKKHSTGGGQYVPLSYGPNDRPLRIQTPPVRIPFGMRQYVALILYNFYLYFILFCGVRTSIKCFVFNDSDFIDIDN